MLIWIILVIVILLVIWVTVGYNGLVRSRMQSKVMLSMNKAL